jgi:regulation of enolase protein 1 (concanavalin A-like superfamily)
MAVTPANGYQFQYGYNTGLSGGTPAVPDAWVRLTRTGNVFTAYRSRDGGNWFKVGQATISMAHDATIGLVVSSHNGGALNTTTFDNVIVTADGGTPVPAPWTSADVGGPMVPGSASYLNGTFSVHGSGSDVWGTADQFQYVSQPLNGDGTITVRATDQDNTDPWAKAGIMIKQSAAAGSPYVAVMVTPGNDAHMQYGFNTEVASTSYRFPDAWLRLKRTGNLFTGYTSADGITWTQFGTATVAISATATAGMFVSSHNPGVLATTTFDNVTLTATGGPLPTGWSDSDVGSPAQAGSAGYAGGVFTVTGGGNDIWGTVDQFHYATRTLTGNGTITARVTAQSNTSDWAKSGVMIKQSTTAGTPYAMLAATPGNGIHFQYNFNGDTSGGTGGPPVWLRLVRTGATVTAYRSADGTAWTTVGSTTLSVTDPVTVGLFVCSHNGGQLNQTTFDNVTVA